MLDMARQRILPAVLSYEKHLSEIALQKKALLPDIDCLPETQLLKKLSKLSGAFYPAIEKLEQLLENGKGLKNLLQEANHYKDVILPCMGQLRSLADQMELLVEQSYWPFPNYGQLLFSV